jgi:hypothetical protein
MRNEMKEKIERKYDRELAEHLLNSECVNTRILAKMVLDLIAENATLKERIKQ